MFRAMLAALGMLAGLASAEAQQWPSRPVTVIVPFAAGSTPDAVARIVASGLEARLGQSFIVENKPGASGNLGTGAVAQAAPDGHTIGVSIVGPLALNTLLFPRLPYDPAKDLALISILVSQPTVLVVSNQLGVKSAAEFMAQLRQNPNKFNYGSIGTGSMSHLAIEAMVGQGGARPVHIPFRGSPGTVTALIRNDVQFALLPVGSVASQHAAGELRMIAVASSRRSQLIPDLPTLGEAGGAEVNADAWIGLIAPARISDAIKERLHQAVRATLDDAAIRDKLRANFIEPVGSSSEEFRARLDAELVRWTPVIRDNGIRIEQ